MLRSFYFPFIAIRRAFLLSAILLVAGCASPEEKAQGHYERGMKLLSQHDHVKASIEFKNALQLKNDLVPAWRGLLEIEQHNKNHQAVIQILHSVVELDRNDIEVKIRLGSFMLAGKAMDQVLELADAALNLNSRHPGALALKAAAFLKLNEGAAARREAQAALEIDPKNAAALIVLAAERMSRGDAEGALLIIDRQGFDPQDELAIQLYKLGLFEQSGDLKQVEAVLRKLSELYPQEVAFRRGLVKLYVEQERMDDAEKELRGLVAANPTDVTAQLSIISFLRAVKGPIQARQELVARINVGGQVFPYQIALAEFDFAQGNITDSVEFLKKLASSAASPDQVLAAQAKLAQIQLSMNNITAADALVAEILRKDGRNADGLKLRALVRMQRGQLDASITDLRQLLNDQPRASEAMLLLATAYERGGSIELAEKQLADALRASGFETSVGLNYVAFLRRRGNPERAEEILTELADRSPSNLSVLSTLADVMLARQNWIGAQAIADKIRKHGDDRGLADQIAGLALSGRSQYEEGIRALERSYASAPAAVQPMAALVNAMVRADKADRAMSFLQTILAANPDNSEAHVLMGSLQLLKNAPDQALKSFRTAIDRQPKDVAGYLVLAEFHIRAKNFDEAEKIFRAGLTEQPNSFAVHMALAGLLELKGDYDAAIAEYEDLLKQQPGSLIVANNLASLLTDHRPDKASLDRAYSMSALLRKSQVPSFNDTLGWIYYLRADYKTAIARLEEAATALPNRPLVQYHLGMSYVADGQLAKAAAQFKKALELAPDAALQVKIRVGQQKAGL